jgi:glucose-6-phosphate 1-dehydrogenase
MPLMTAEKGFGLHSISDAIPSFYGIGVLTKIRPGVGPRFPQVVVLIGATGDLSRRKLLPGLFHLSSVGFIPGCRIIGVSLDELDPDGFRTLAREALDQFSTRKVSKDEWISFAENLDYIPMAAGPEVLKAAVDKAEAALGGASTI